MLSMALHHHVHQVHAWFERTHHARRSFAEHIVGHMIEEVAQNWKSITKSTRVPSPAGVNVQGHWQVNRAWRLGGRQARLTA
jgi:hypothetical protein